MQGKLPADRVALRELLREMETWPFLELEAGAGAEDGGAGPSIKDIAEKDLAPIAQQPRIGGLPRPGLPEPISPRLHSATLTVTRPAPLSPAPPLPGRPKEGAEAQLEGPLALLPDWLGYGLLYAVSAAPVMIVVAAVSVLWVNSLR